MALAAPRVTAQTNEAAQEAALDTRAEATGKEVTVTGCLTAAPDRARSS